MDDSVPTEAQICTEETDQYQWLAPHEKLPSLGNVGIGVEIGGPDDLCLPRKLRLWESDIWEAARSDVQC